MDYIGRDLLNPSNESDFESSSTPSNLLRYSLPSYSLVAQPNIGRAEATGPTGSETTVGPSPNDVRGRGLYPSLPAESPGDLGFMSNPSLPHHEVPLETSLSSANSCIPADKAATCISLTSSSFVRPLCGVNRHRPHPCSKRSPCRAPLAARLSGMPGGRRPYG